MVSIQNANKCKLTDDPIENWFVEHFPHIFHFTAYSPIKAVFAKLMNTIATFTWTYMDLFVMIISMGLVSRFKQINNSLMKHKGKV